jgi:hypothetical protein
MAQQANLPLCPCRSLANNSLQGPLVPSWSNLTYLEELDVSYNQITGPLPDAWSLLGSLQQLDVAYNSLTGTLPVTWSSLTMLEVWHPPSVAITTATHGLLTKQQGCSHDGLVQGCQLHMPWRAVVLHRQLHLT